MTKKPARIQSIVPESKIIEDYQLPISKKNGRSRVISSWIWQGLKSLEVGDRRFFLEDDLVDFLYSKYTEQMRGSKNKEANVKEVDV